MALKTKKNAISFAAYLKKLSPEQRKEAQLLVPLFKKATGKTPVMWGERIVGFGEYHYKSEKSSQEGDWPLTGFAISKAGSTIYIMPGLQKYKALLTKIGKVNYSTGSCLYLPKIEKISTAPLAELIKSAYVDMKKRYGIMK